MGDILVKTLMCTWDNSVRQHSGKLNHEPKCFKNVVNLCFLDLILTNYSKCSPDSVTFETWLSDFHSLAYSVTKSEKKTQMHRLWEIWQE